MNRFSLEKVLKLKNLNEKKEIDVVKYHYDKILYKIKEAYNQYKEGCYYDVDLFVSKLPLYDSSVVAQKLVEYMEKKGLQCKVVYQNRIFVWWKSKERTKEHLQIIRKEIENRIEHFAKENKDCCFYNIPIFLSGFPWYNAEEAASAMSKKFAKKGFSVKRDKQLLYISWKKEDLGSRVNINFDTDEEKRKKALEKINFINENRYVDFINPKKSKSNKDNFMIKLSNLKNNINKYI